MAVSAGSDFMLLLCIRVYCIFPTLPLDVENTVIHAQSLKVAVSVGTGLIILFCVRMYCIFSTLPLNVENTAHPYAEFECDGFLCFREKREIERKVKKLLRYFCGCGTMSLDDSIQSIIRKTPKVLASGFFYS